MRDALSIVLVVALGACGGGESRPSAPPPPAPHAPADAGVTDDDAWFHEPTDEGPRSLPPRAGAHPCPEDRCWTPGPDGEPAACLLPGGPLPGPDPHNNRSDSLCGGGGDRCSHCVCAGTGTPIATPDGEVAIETLAVGDLVLSVHQGVLQPVPLIEVSRVAVHDHTMVTVTLDDGRRLSMSPMHPTADGGTFFELAAGSRLGDAQIVAVDLEPYPGAYTHDILPASDTGSYVAAGVLVGSTLFRPGS